MPRYFINQENRCVGECLVDEPANPDNHQIIEHPPVDGDVSLYRLVDGELVAEAVDPPTPEEVEKTYIAAVQAMMDAAAQAHGYDDIVSACSYAGYANAFQAEGLSFGQWRAEIWVYGYAEMAKIKSGERTLPSIEDFLAELPARVVPGN